MKDYYTLPWTCEQSDKVKYVLRWVGMIVLPILGIVGMYLVFTNNSNFGIIFGIPFSLFGFIFGSMLWGTAYVDEFVKFPEFRCKHKEDSMT